VPELELEQVLAVELEPMLLLAPELAQPAQGDQPESVPTVSFALECSSHSLE
jgi:hypothetical protein